MDDVMPANERQREMLAFDESDQEIRLTPDTQLPIEELLRLHPAHPWVVQSFDSGLTARVYRASYQGQELCVKLKRSQSLVRNLDGRLSFLTEVMRRRDISELAAQGQQLPVVETLYASYRQGIIVSRWADGETWQDFDPPRINQLYQYLADIYLAGLFDWDLCSGNIVSDGKQIHLFDFGYMWPFDPLTEHNSDGLANPLFHPVERFETRNLSGYLLRLELAGQADKALKLFRMQKTIGLEVYQGLLRNLIEQGASCEVQRRFEHLIHLWKTGLASEQGLYSLYQLEMFRSHVLDVADDLHGQSCTQQTLARLTRIQSTLTADYEFLRDHDGLFFGDEGLSQGQLLEKYREQEQQAQQYLLPGHQSEIRDSDAI